MCKPHNRVRRAWLGFLWVPHTKCISIRPVYAWHSALEVLKAGLGREGSREGPREGS